MKRKKRRGSVVNRVDVKSFVSYPVILDFSFYASPKKLYFLLNRDSRNLDENDFPSSVGILGKYLSDVSFHCFLAKKVLNSCMHLGRIIENLGSEGRVLVKSGFGEFVDRRAYEYLPYVNLENVLSQHPNSNYRFTFTILAEFKIQTGKNTNPELSDIPYYEDLGMASFLDSGTRSGILNELHNKISEVKLRGVIAYASVLAEDNYRSIPVCLTKRILPGYEPFLPYLEMYSLFNLWFAYGYLLRTLYFKKSCSPKSKWENLTTAFDEGILKDFMESVSQLPVVYPGIRLKDGDKFYGIGSFPVFYGAEPTDNIEDIFQRAPEKLISHFSSLVRNVGMFPFRRELSTNYVRDYNYQSMLLIGEFLSTPWKSFLPFYITRDNEIYLSFYNPFLKAMKSGVVSSGDVTAEDFLNRGLDACFKKRVGNTIGKDLFPYFRGLYFLDRDEDGNLFVNNVLYKFFESSILATMDPVSRNLPVFIDASFGGFENFETVSGGRGTQADSFRFFLASHLMELFMRSSARIFQVDFQPELAAQILKKVLVSQTPFPSVNDELRRRLQGEQEIEIEMEQERD